MSATEDCLQSSFTCVLWCISNIAVSWCTCLKWRVFFTLVNLCRKKEWVRLLSLKFGGEDLQLESKLAPRKKTFCKENRGWVSLKEENISRNLWSSYRSYNSIFSQQCVRQIQVPESCRLHCLHSSAGFPLRCLCRCSDITARRNIMLIFPIFLSLKFHIRQKTLPRYWGNKSV